MVWLEPEGKLKNVKISSLAHGATRTTAKAQTQHERRAALVQRRGTQAWISADWHPYFYRGRSAAIRGASLPAGSEYVSDSLFESAPEEALRARQGAMRRD